MGIVKGTANFGISEMDWQQRVNWDRLREYGAHKQDFIVPLGTLDATDAAGIGPKLVNLAMLMRAALPTPPGGFCLTAHAYRAQMEELGLDAVDGVAGVVRRNL